MRIIITIGLIFVLGPLSSHKVLGDIYNPDFNFNEDYGSGEGPDVDPTFEDHEGSGYGKGGGGHHTPTGPYGSSYDATPYSEDDEAGDDMFYDDDTYGRHDTHHVYHPVEGSADRPLPDEEEDEDDDFIWGEEETYQPEIDSGTKEDDFNQEGPGVEIYEPEFEIDKTVVVEVESVPERLPTTTPPPTLKDNSDMDSSIQIQNSKADDREPSIFSQPDILGAFIGGTVVGLFCAILIVMFIVYRMRKKDEGSYPLDEPKRIPLTSSYSPNDKEIYA